MKELKIDEILKFNVYGTTITGKFRSKEDGLITIEVISDSTRVSNPGDIEDIHETYLISQ